MIIDLFLLIGVFAAYAQDHEVVSFLGAAGFMTTVTGILVVRSSRAFPGVDLYPAGALAVAVGWTLLAFASWRAGAASVAVPALFVLSLVTAIAGQLAGFAQPAFVASGVIFGAAVVAVGWQIQAAVSENTPRPKVNARSLRVDM